MLNLEVKEFLNRSEFSEDVSYIDKITVEHFVTRSDQLPVFAPTWSTVS